MKKRTKTKTQPVVIPVSYTHLSDFDEAAKEYVKDLIFYANYQDDRIEELAVRLVNSMFKEYNDNLDKIIKEKVEDLMKL